MVHGAELSLIGRAMACAVVLSLATPVDAQEAKQRRVLGLYVTTPSAPGAETFDSVYRRTLNDALGTRFDYVTEFIDLAHFSEPDYQDTLAAFLRYKYKDLPLDLVFAPTEGARRFVERFRGSLFPDLPVVFIDRVTSTRPEPGMTGISAALDLTGTLSLARSLQPGITQVFVVSGVSPFDQFYERLAREQFQQVGSLTTTYLSGLSLADLEQRVAHLPRDSVIYFLSLGQDGAGNRFISAEAVDRLAEVTSVPIYSWHNVGMGHGIVGGQLYSNEVVAERAAAVSLRILRGDKADSIPVVSVDPFVSQVDWRQLQRWGISEARIPAGTNVLFKVPSVWEQYWAYFIAATALLLAQSVLIGGLLVQAQRRRRAEARSHDLAGRLLGAQEAERSRIARELHDDVSQQAAILAIDLQVLRDSHAKGNDIDALAAQALEQTTAIAHSVHALSHQLHPAKLQLMGLVRTLDGLPREFASADMDVVVTNRNVPDTLLPDLALCLYRIVQEALRNAVNHGAARNVAVDLTGNETTLTLVVADDGSGFDVGRSPSSGLGLVSMRERLEPLGGVLTIQSTPGQGTRVTVIVPALIPRPAVG